ncbi:hypothetical protein CEXT_315081 [Caerostris extrusa]|uniref:Uncharacterized protein n=1 Tax=Caerostris extrusa TaxID=172846 RepID=A0AAV4N8P6_CAEEX|nr:hypothetical protein CEXT_315081 [Caerostris extrusa]
MGDGRTWERGIIRNLLQRRLPATPLSDPLPQSGIEIEVGGLFHAEEQCACESFPPTKRMGDGRTWERGIIRNLLQRRLPATPLSDPPPQSGIEIEVGGLFTRRNNGTMFYTTGDNTIEIFIRTKFCCIIFLPGIAQELLF